MSMKKQKKSIVSVRLSKTSSARPVLNSANRNNDPSHVEKIAKILDDDRIEKDETTHGKLPVEAAYIIMKRITEASGLPVKPVGLSTFNKLQSLRTEPALKLLLNQSWHNFFTTQESDRKQRLTHKVRTLENSNSVQTINSLTNNFSATNLMDPTTKLPQDCRRQQQADMFDNIQPIFNNLCSRVEELWYKLSMSRADQKFYRKSLLRGPAESLEQCREIANYIEMLQLHYQTTIVVLESIRVREENVNKCYTLLLTLADKYNTQIQQQQQAAINSDKSSGGNTSRPTSSTRRGRETSGIRAKFEGIASRQYQLAHSLENNMYWKEELLMLLDAIRCNTLDVVQDIQEWRQWLYRPLPFIWNGVNYLEKIKYDMSIFETDNYLKIAECIPLHYEDLLGVVFFAPGATRPEQNYESRPLSIQNDEYISSILHEFTSNIDRDELYSAVTVVLDDATLQDAISIEGQSLLQRGVFIPTLKLSPLANTTSANNNSNDQQGGRNSNTTNNNNNNHKSHDNNSVSNHSRRSKEESVASGERQAKSTSSSTSGPTTSNTNTVSDSQHKQHRDQSHLAWLQEQEREQRMENNNPEDGGRDVEQI